MYWPGKLSGIVIMALLSLQPLSLKPWGLVSADESPGVYRLEYIPSATPDIDGLAGDESWKSAQVETAFSFPWITREPPSTAFRAFYNQASLYLMFEVEDRDLVIIPGESEKSVASGDRVEVFIAVREDMSRYFCLEIGPHGKVLDYSASFYRKFDEDWDLEGLRTAGRVTQTGYTVEAEIPLQWFKNNVNFDIENEKQLLIGLYRGEFSHDRRGGITEEWISWIDPETPEPDFHVPSSLGRFILD